MAKADRGFASMDRAKRRAIASKGGKIAHQKGSAHEWTRDASRAAGRKGGLAPAAERSFPGSSPRPADHLLRPVGSCYPPSRHPPAPAAKRAQ